MTIAAGNLAVLDQGLALLERIDDVTYRSQGTDGGSSIGAHMRHCIDFFNCFLDGLADARIDYDARSRDGAIASERAVAIGALHTIVEGLASLEPRDAPRPLEVSADADATAPDARWCPSSIGRELQVLLSHTVHHYALIAVALRAHGIEPDTGFGVAPSTLAWEAESSAVDETVPAVEACAR